MTSPVYVAHPQSTYGTSWEADCLQAIANAFPDAELVNPRDLFESNDDRKRRGPIVIADVDMVVVFTDARSWVGLGVLTEMALAVAHRKPCCSCTPYTGCCARKRVSANRTIGPSLEHPRPPR